VVRDQGSAGKGDRLEAEGQKIRKSEGEKVGALPIEAKGWRLEARRLERAKGPG